MMSPHANAGRRHVLFVVAVVLAAAATLGLALHDEGGSRAGAAAAGGPLPGGSPATATSPAPDAGEPSHKLIVPTDRRVKADLLDRMGRAPEVLIFGGSRATRFEPAYLEELTGLHGFNLALQNGRPEDAWAFLNYILKEHPDARPRVVWFVHVEAFRAQGLSAGLVQDERLSGFFPEQLLERERDRLPRTEAEMPAGRDLALTTYAADGVVVRNRYDLRAERGYTLERALAWSIRRATERYATTDPALDPRSVAYFEKTLALLNRLETSPAVVLMPLHPQLLDAVRDLGWEARHREVLDYLSGLQQGYDFVTLDLSRLDSVKGDPNDFYDGFHVRRSNARRILRTVVEEAPASFR